METMTLAADRQIRLYYERLLKKPVTNEQTFIPVKDQPALLINKSDRKEPKQQVK